MAVSMVSKAFQKRSRWCFRTLRSSFAIVHMVRHSLNYVAQRDRKAVADDLKAIYGASTARPAEMNLEAFETKWDKTHPSISKAWRRNWDNITPFFAYSPEIRKVVYTTNAIESLNMSVRKTTKTRGSFPNDEAMFKLLYLTRTSQRSGPGRIRGGSWP
jgi:putative transposase